MKLPTGNNILNREIKTDAKLRLLTKILHCDAFDKSIQKRNLPKISNSWLRRTRNFCQFAEPNMGFTAA